MLFLLFFFCLLFHVKYIEVYRQLFRANGKAQRRVNEDTFRGTGNTWTYKETNNLFYK